MFGAMLVDFVEVGNDIWRSEQREVVEGILEHFPVPIFGSPPRDISSIAQLLQGSTVVAAVGYGAWSDSPALVVLAAGTAMVVWFAKPSANVLRRSLAQRIARKVGTEYHSEDEK